MAEPDRNASTPVSDELNAERVDKVISGLVDIGDRAQHTLDTGGRDDFDPREVPWVTDDAAGAVRYLYNEVLRLRHALEAAATEAQRLPAPRLSPRPLQSTGRHQMTAPDQTNAEVSDERLREDPLTNKLPMQDEIETILFRRSLEGTLMGGTLPTAHEIAQLLERRSVTSQASEGAEEMEVEITGIGRDGHTGKIKMLTIADDRYKTSERFVPAFPSTRVERLETATHRHVKRGSEYVLIGYGKMQAEGWYAPKDGSGPAFPIDSDPVDMAEVAIYRSVDDGSLWVRPREEFEDGRFQALQRGRS